MRRLSLETKMALGITLFFLALVPATSYNVISYFQKQLKKSVCQQQLRLVDQEAGELDYKFRLLQDALVRVAASRVAPEIFRDPKRAQRFVNERITLQSLFANDVCCFDPQGVLIAETALRPPRVGTDFSYREYLARTLAGRKPVISLPYLSSQPHHHPAVMFTAPVFNRDGTLAGILGGSLDLYQSNLFGDLARARIGERGYYYLIDPRRIMVMHPDRSRILERGPSPGVNRLLDRALKGFEGIGETVNSRGVPMLTAFRRLKSTGWILGANLPAREAYALAKQAERGLWAFVTVFGLLLSLTVWLGMRRLTAPLLSLTRQVREAQTLGRVEVTANDEIGDLAEAFNRQLEVIRLNQLTLLKERELFQTLADFSTTWVFWRTEDGVTSYHSPACAAVTGYSALELAADATLMDRMVHPDDRARWQEHLHLVDSAGSPLPLEFRIVTKKGKLRWIEHSCQPAVDDQGRFQGTRGSNRDITERKAAERSLAESEARFRRFFEDNGSVMLLVDPETGTIVDANPSAAGYYGYALAQLIGSSVERINILDPTQMHAERQRAVRRECNHFNFLHRLGSGEVRAVEVYSTPILDQKRTLLFSIVHDVTERKKGEQELHEQEARLRQEIAERQRAEASLSAKRQQLEDLNRSLEERIALAVAELRRKDQVMITQSRQAAMGEMIGNIAHQWRQPLNALGLLLANIKDAHQFGELDDGYLERSIGDGNRLIQKMSATINDFRNFFSPGKEPVPFDAARQLAETIALVDSSFKSSSIEIRLNTPVQVTLLGFPNEYSQVLLNLIYNARDAIVSRGTVPGRIAIELSQRDGQGSVTVTDNGGGIAPSAMDRIFEPYFSTKEMGTGIGLYMSQMIIERNMRGSIQAANVEGGARFTVLTPLAGGAP